MQAQASMFYVCNYKINIFIVTSKIFRKDDFSEILIDSNINFLYF